MSFGFGVGDFLAVIKLAVKVRRDFVAAPEQLRSIEKGVTNLVSMMRDIEDVKVTVELSGESEVRLAELSTQGHQILKQLERFAEENQRLLVESKGISSKSKKVWTRVTFQNHDVDEYKKCLEAYCVLLTQFCAKLNSQTAFETKAAVLELQDSRETQARDKQRKGLLDWLATIDYTVQQADNLDRRQEGTGKWLLDSDEYQRWIVGDSDSESKLLYCPGMPGSGKTMMCSIVIEDLLSRFGDDDRVGVSYVFINFRRQNEQQVKDILVNILKQLLRQVAVIPASIDELYKKCSAENTYPQLPQISEALCTAIRTLSRSFIVIDAIDEFQLSQGNWRDLVDSISEIQASSGANIFVTSRLIPEILEVLKPISTFQEIRASQTDLQIYLRGRVSALRKFVAKDPRLQNKIVTKIVENADGMFLLAVLNFDSLKGVKSPRALEDALHKLPKGFKGYDTAYDDAMDRIRSQVYNSQDLAKQTLSWIVCAKRPLSGTELQYALAIEIDEPKFDPGNLSDIDDIISDCCGLVVLDGESNVVRLVHYTLQEYFERFLDEQLPEARDFVLKTCLTYLNFEIYPSSDYPPPDDESPNYPSPDDEAQPVIYPGSSFDYVLFHWPDHWREAHHAKTEIPAFLKDERKVAKSMRKGYPPEPRDSKDTYDYIWVFDSFIGGEPTGMHVCAYFGLEDLVTAFIEQGYNHNCKTKSLKTTLSIAASQGHESVVEALLRRDDLYPDEKDDEGDTALHQASRNGHHNVCRLLMTKGNVNPTLADGEGLTAMERAVRWDILEVVKVLAAHPAVKLESSLLSIAARRNSVNTVRFLLQTGRVDPNYQGHKVRTPLIESARNNGPQISALLLEHGGLDVNKVDTEGRTALSWAALRGLIEVMEILLARSDVDVDLRDYQGRTPLSHAAASDGPEYNAIARNTAIRLLLGNGADVNLTDNQGLTPLHRASMAQCNEQASLLLGAEGVDLFVKDTEGHMVLWHAFTIYPKVLFGDYCTSCTKDVLSLLMEKSKVDNDVRARVLDEVRDQPFEDLETAERVASKCRELLATSGIT